MKAHNLQVTGSLVAGGEAIGSISSSVATTTLGLGSRITTIEGKSLVSGSSQVDVMSTTNIARLATTGSNTFQGLQTVNGSLVVTGSLTAQQFIVSSSVTYLTTSFASGSTKFGDSADDNHNFTGSVYVSGSLSVTTGTFGVGVSSNSGNSKVEISAGESLPALRLTRTTFSGYGSQLHFSTTGSNRFVIGLNPNEDLYFDRDTTGVGGWNPTTMIIQRSTGNIGISTSTPNNLLSIRGNLDLGATGYAYVGPSQYGGIMFPRGQILFSNTNSQNQLYLSSNAYTNASGVFSYRNSSQPALALGLDNGGISFNTAGNGTADATISWNTPLIVDNTGVYVANTNTPINLKPENTPSTAITSLSSASATYNQKPGVYWLNYGSQIFLGYVRFNWHQGRNWVLALKCHNVHDMPAGSALWQNNTLVNQSDFNLQSGRMAKYGAWNNFAFTRLLYEMGNRIPPIMQWTASKTSLYSVFSSITVGNPSGVGPDSTDPQISTSATTTYSGMVNFLGPNFTDFGGAEPNICFYGLGSFANNSNNSTSAANTGNAYGFGLTTEHLGTFSALQSTGRSGAWIGAPMDEGAHVFNATSSGGADSGFGLGVAGGNNARTSTSGIISWALGNSVANHLPAYVWLSID